MSAITIRRRLVGIVLAACCLGAAGGSVRGEGSVSAIGWICTVDGEPVEGAVIRLFDRFPTLHGSTWASVDKPVSTVRSGPGGRFRVAIPEMSSHASSRSLRLHVESDLGVAITGRFGLDHPSTDLGRVRLWPRASLRVTTVDSDGKLVPDVNAVLRLTGPGEDREAGQPERVVLYSLSRADGRLSFLPIPQRPDWKAGLLLWRGDYAPETVRFASLGENIDRTVPLKPGAEVTISCETKGRLVRVYDEGDVWKQYGPLINLPAGKQTRVTGLHPGRGGIRYACADRNWLLRSTVASIAELDRPSNILVNPPTSDLSSHVLDEVGDPVIGSRVYLLVDADHEERVPIGSVGRDGSFTIKGLVAGHSGLLVAYPRISLRTEVVDLRPSIGTGCPLLGSEDDPGLVELRASLLGSLLIEFTRVGNRRTVIKGVELRVDGIPAYGLSWQAEALLLYATPGTHRIRIHGTNMRPKELNAEFARDVAGELRVSVQ